MANDTWRMLIKQQPEERSISKKWLNRKPTLEEFGLEEYNLNALYKSKKKFETNKEERSSAMRKELPRYDRKKTINKEGYICLLFLIALTGYQFLSEEPSFLVVGFLGIGAIAFFSIYYIKLRRDQMKTKKLIEEINKKQRRIDAEEFTYEEAYVNLERYSRAVFDYEAWERRKKTTSWKNCFGRVFQSELISMFKTYGYDADFADRKNLSIIYEDAEGSRTAVYCKTHESVKQEEIKLFLRAMERNEISRGLVISSKGCNTDAEEICKNAGIEVWTIKEILGFEKMIEEREE